MFQWICNGCGRVWDVSVAECPDCAGGARPQSPAARAGVRFRMTPASRWLLLGGIFVLLVVAAYLVVPGALDSLRQARADASAPSAPQAAAPTVLPLERVEPLRDAVEVSGLRIYPEPDGRARVVALVTNHGSEELKYLSCRVDLRRAGDPQRSLLGSFRFELQTTLAPGSFLEVRAPLELAAPASVLPDWRQLQAQLESCSKQ